MIFTKYYTATKILSVLAMGRAMPSFCQAINPQDMAGWRWAGRGDGSLRASSPLATGASAAPQPADETVSADLLTKSGADPPRPPTTPLYATFRLTQTRTRCRPLRRLLPSVTLFNSWHASSPLRHPTAPGGVNGSSMCYSSTKPARSDRSANSTPPPKRSPPPPLSYRRKLRGWVCQGAG